LNGKCEKMAEEEDQQTQAQKTQKKNEA